MRAPLLPDDLDAPPDRIPPELLEPPPELLILPELLEPPPELL